VQTVRGAALAHNNPLLTSLLVQARLPRQRQDPVPEEPRAAVQSVLRAKSWAGAGADVLAWLGSLQGPLQ
jgi:hypothetical protein